MPSVSSGSAKKIAAATCAAFGLLIASTAMSRVEGSGFGGSATTIARAATLFELFTMACFFRFQAPPIRRVTAFGCLCTIVYVALFSARLAGVDLWVGSTGLEASQLIGLFCGLSEGTFIIVLCFLFSVQEPRMGAVSVAAGCFLFDVLTAIATVVPASATPALKLTCLAFGLIALVYSLGQAASDESLAPEIRNLVSRPDGYIRTSRTLPKGQRAGFLSCVVVFPFLYGVAMQIVNASGLGTYNIVYQLVVSAVVASLLVYVAVRGGSLQSTTLLLLAAPVIFGAYVLIAISGPDGLFAVGLLSRVDYSVCQLVFIVTLARLSHASIGETCYYTALFYGTLKLAALLGREFATGFLPLPLDQGQSVTVALAALGLTIACCVCVALSGRRVANEFETDTTQQVDVHPHPDKAALFAQTHSLSTREAQIFQGFTRGFNMASIGEEAGVSASTVGTYMHRIYVKVGVEGKQGLAEAYDAFQPEERADKG